MLDQTLGLGGQIVLDVISQRPSARPPRVATLVYVTAAPDEKGTRRSRHLRGFNACAEKKGRESGMCTVGENDKLDMFEGQRADSLHCRGQQQATRIDGDQRL